MNRPKESIFTSASSASRSSQGLNFSGRCPSRALSGRKAGATMVSKPLSRICLCSSRVEEGSSVVQRASTLNFLIRDLAEYSFFPRRAVQWL